MQTATDPHVCVREHASPVVSEEEWKEGGFSRAEKRKEESDLHRQSVSQIREVPLHCGVYTEVVGQI